MKIGDKYLCIKTRPKHTNSYITINTEGKFYEIIDIINRRSYGHDVVVVTNDVKDQTYFYSATPTNQLYYFYDFFIDIKKQRKLKIQKLNEII